MRLLDPPIDTTRTHVQREEEGRRSWAATLLVEITNMRRVYAATVFLRNIFLCQPLWHAFWEGPKPPLSGRSFGWSILLYGLGQNSVAGKMLTLLDFGTFLKIPRIVGKSSAHPIGVSSMPPTLPKCHIRQQ